MSRKAQLLLGFLNYYRKYVPRLTEGLAPFYKILKSDEKVLVSKELIQFISSRKLTKHLMNVAT